MNILIARSQTDGHAWMERLHTKPAYWLVLNCTGIPETIRGYRPDAIFITPMAAHWFAENRVDCMSEIRNRTREVFTITD